MIEEICIGQALVAVESDKGCGACVLARMIDMDGAAGCHGELGSCFSSYSRKDGKRVIFIYRRR
jgi:hypothetical protein